MKLNKLLLALAASGLATSAFATNGYFSHGYGMTAKGMGGAATAVTKDTFGGANNPATMVWVGNRYDVGVDAFSPDRSAGNPGGTLSAQGNSSDNELFGIPEFGYNKMLNDKLSFGVTVYGNGGMNTDYPTVSGSNIFGGNSALGVDLTQLIIAPTLSYKVSNQTSIGISPLWGYQTFAASGLDGFAVISSSPANLTNNGKDDANGFGARVGVYTKVNDTVSVGAAYSTKIDMSKWDKYKGLFAEQGDFDVPENWNIGISFTPNNNVTVAFDYQKISYGGVRATANPSTNTDSLGTDAGRGFGWSDIDVMKLGVEYKYNPNMILRAGYSHGDHPMGARDVTFNILAPAVIEDHITLGMTYNPDKNSEIVASYVHALNNAIVASPLAGFGFTGSHKIEMSQNSIGLAYSKKF